MAFTSVLGFSLFPLLYLILFVTFPCGLATGKRFSIEEATVHDLQLAFQRNQLTSRQLVEFYFKQIHKLNPILKGVLEKNPDALAQADRADQERRAKAPGTSFSWLHGIPILVKDNIATKDKMNTTAGSFALLGSVVPRDAGVVARLRKAGAIILGKASLSEWSHFRSTKAPGGWNARGGQGKNPYTMGDPCGSSSGSAISVAANLVAVSLGTETDGSILCPSDFNSVVGIKPTVGLTSRAGVVPISPRQDTVGPICRTVSDAAYVLETIAGIDINDKATIKASKYVPKGGYAQFLKKDGLRGKRLGVVRVFYNFGNDTFLHETYELHLKTLRQRGAVLIDNLEIDSFNEINSDTSENIALDFEFKLSLNAYLKNLVASPVRTLADVIAYNKKHPKEIYADWQAAKAYKDSGFIFHGIVEGFNGGGLIVRFSSLLGFLPFPLLSPLHSCKDPEKTMQEIAEGLRYSLISMKVIEADEGKWNLVFSEKEAAWSSYSGQVKVGGIFEGRVSSVEDYGAFVHLLFPDGLYHLTGLVHISEVSWDLVGDVRDILAECDEVRVKVISVDREKSRISLSIKQLEEDPLLENLGIVLPQEGLAYPNSLGGGDSSRILPLPGLERILEELLQEDGIDDARIRRQRFEKGVISQDLQLWLSNAPPTNQRFNLLALAGRQMQEIHLTTSLDQEGIKKALQRVLQRIP